MIRVLGKGQRQRLAPIATEQLSVALGERLEQMARDTEYVVPGRGGSRMDESSVRKMLQRTCERLGVRRLNPHAFRHAFAAEAVRSGVHIKSVQRALGHSTLSTTDHYLQSLAGAEELTSAFADFDKGGS